MTDGKRFMLLKDIVFDTSRLYKALPSPNGEGTILMLINPTDGSLEKEHSKIHFEDFRQAFCRRLLEQDLP